jgi:hypothetical protein
MEPETSARCAAFGSGKGGGRAAENVEEGISLRVNLDAAVGTERIAQETVVLGQGLGVALGTELVQEPGRALDVSEEEGDRAGGKITPHRRHDAHVDGHVPSDERSPPCQRRRRAAAEDRCDGGPSLRSQLLSLW